MAVRVSSIQCFYLCSCVNHHDVSGIKHIAVPLDLHAHNNRICSIYKYNIVLHYIALFPGFTPQLFLPCVNGEWSLHGNKATQHYCSHDNT